MTPAWNNALTALAAFGPLPIVVLVAVFGRRSILVLPSTGFVVGGLLWVGFCVSELGGEGRSPGPEAVTPGLLIGFILAATYLAIGGPFVYMGRYFSRRTSN